MKPFKILNFGTCLLDLIQTFAAINTEILKISTFVRPTGAIFFSVGDGPFDAIIAAYATSHAHPIIQHQCKLRQPNLNEMKDDEKRANMLAMRIVDVAKKYYKIGNSLSPQQNILQD